MFRKIRTTINGQTGTVSQDRQYQVDAGAVERDMAEQRRELRQMAQSYGRISSVEQTMTTMVITYTSGTVVIYLWIAE
jgi:two-component SAPR family response regulator